MAHQPPRLRTLVLVLALAKAAILMAIVFVAWIRPLRRIEGYPARLVSEASALYEAPRERAIHRQPTASGSFGERAAVGVPALAGAMREVKDLLPAAKNVASGEQPLADLPPQLTPALARAHADLAELLAGTRASLGKLPPQWSGFGLTADARLAPLVTFGDTSVAVALEIRQALAKGQGREALELCTDGLALGRDLSLAAEGQPLVWHMYGAAFVMRLAPACAEAARADPAEASRMFRTIRDAFPPFSETLQRELVCLELFLFSPSIGDDPAGLGPHGRACLSKGAEQRWNLVQLWVASETWPDFRELREALVAAEKLEAPAARRKRADEAYRAIAGRAGLLSTMFLGVSIPNFGRTSTRADDTRTRLDALVALSAATAVRNRTGSWPTTIEELVTAGVLTQEEGRRLAPATLLRGGAGLRVRVPLSGGEDGKPALLELSVAADAPPTRP